MANKNRKQLQCALSLLSLISISTFAAAQDDVYMPTSANIDYENPIVIKELVEDPLLDAQEQQPFNAPDATLNMAATIQQAGYKIISEDEEYIYAETNTIDSQKNTPADSEALPSETDYDESTYAEEDQARTRNKRALVIRPGSDRERRWPHGGQIPYYLHRNLSDAQKQTFRRAATHYNSKTNLYLFELNDLHERRTRANFPYHINVIPFSKNYSQATVGKTKLDASNAIHSNLASEIEPTIGEFTLPFYPTTYRFPPQVYEPSSLAYFTNYIALSSGVTFSTVLHEIGHVAGLTHEQKRSDRDQYVKVHRDRIQSEYYHNFDTVDDDDYLAVGAYDYQSIMHYSPYAFSKDASPTITARNNQSLSGNELSTGDILALNLMYPKDGVCPDGYLRTKKKRKYKRFLGIMISKRTKTVTWCDI